MKNRIQIIVFLILSNYIYGQKYGGGPNTFYQLQTSPREVALGYSGIASSQGPFSIYWNPAGLAYNESKTMYSLIYPFSVQSENKLSIHNSNSNTLSIGMMKGRLLDYENLFFAFNFFHRNYGDITRTDLNINNEIQENGTFDYANNLIAFSVSNKIQNIYTGFTIKWTHYSSGQMESSAGFGADFGLRVDLNQKTTYGFAIKYDQYQDQRQIRTGIGIKHQFRNSSIDIDFNGGDNISPEIGSGIEVLLSKSFFLRSGINLSKNELSGGFSPRFIGFGFGFNSRFPGTYKASNIKLKFDFSYSK